MNARASTWQALREAFRSLGEVSATPRGTHPGRAGTPFDDRR